MARCKSCGERTPWWNKECKECEMKSRREWMAAHTFRYGETVRVMHDGIAFGRATVISRQDYNDDYCADTYYKVLYPNGQVEKYGNWCLEKTEVGNDGQ